jgi:hypothetical protein
MSVFISSKIISKISYEEQSSYYDSTEMANKLFCTFSQKSQLDYRLNEITSQYTIMYGKIFVLVSPESEEYLCTYNVDLEDRTKPIISNTILVHRKKESNTLYTINALNCLIKSLNDGVLDLNYRVNWQDYNNSVLLTQGDQFRKLNTLIHKIITL